jgi:dTDP-4-amino-4,6-dideoxygalactose transaminase
MPAIAFQDAKMRERPRDDRGQRLPVSQSFAPDTTGSAGRAAEKGVEAMAGSTQQLVLTRPLFGDEELRRLRDCLQSGWVTQGPLVREFERLVAERHRTTYALATTSCTAALHLAAMALELGPGDEVIVPAFTWVTSAHSAEYVGARAVFADVAPETFNLDPAAFEAAITPRTRAVVVVHLFGLAAELGPLLAIARKHSLHVIEDAACAIGTEYDGRPVGGWGDLGCFSFHPRKVVTTGEGGMVTTNAKDLAQKVMSLRNHGACGHPGQDLSAMKPYTMGRFDALGFNLRMSDLLAAVGVAQMERLQGLLNERRALAARYRELLRDVGEFALPAVPPKCGHTYQSFVLRVRKGGLSRRNHIMDYLARKNIQTRPGTHAVHRLGYYVQKYGLRPEQYPVAAASEDTSITLPMFPGMTEENQKTVVRSLRESLTL